MGQTTIEWTGTPLADGTLLPGYTFNPWWGCIKVSAGCEHCYAESQAKYRGFDVWGPASTTPRRFLSLAYWRAPLAWNRAAADRGIRSKVFCASFADVFEANPALDTERTRLFALIRRTPNLDWLLLTKRPENIAHMLPEGFWPNVWLGTSAENQHWYNTRVPILIEQTKRAPVLFVSVEPMLEAIDLGAGFDVWCGATALSMQCHPAVDGKPAFCSEAYTKAWPKSAGPQHKPCREPILDYVDWIIVGGESGAKHRPFDVEWARQARDICRVAGKAFFFKQHGGRTHAAGGCLIDGVEVKEFPTPRLPVVA